MDRWRDEPEMRLALVLLVGSVPLIAAGTAGIAASPLLVLGLLALAAVGAAVGRVVPETTWGRLDPDRFVADLWLGPAIAAAVIVFYLDATPGEVQALGGLLGLAGMANYFLRPIYRLIYALVVRATNH